MNRCLKVLVAGLFLTIVTPGWAIMSGNPVDVMEAEAEHNQGQLSLESNFIFESDISPDKSGNDQTEQGEWYLLKGTANLNDVMDFYVRAGVSRLEQKDTTANVEMETEWALAFGGGFTIRLYEYEPLDFKVFLDSQYFATFPDVKSVRIGVDVHTSGITEASYEENNIQMSLISRIKTGRLFPYAGVRFSYRDISNKFTVNNVDYNLSGENKNKVGLTAGFDFPFDMEDLVSGTGILSVEARFFDEFGLSVALTNRF